MKLTAVINQKNGKIKFLPVIAISTWKGLILDKSVNKANLNDLLNQFAFTGQMRIYTHGLMKGNIDAFEDCIYKDSQLNIDKLIDDKGNILFERNCINNLV
jgi:hypothetical protein